MGKYCCIKQHDITDCAAACIATVCKYYRYSTSISKIRQLAGTDEIGTSAYGLLHALEKLNFTAKVVKGDKESFYAEYPLPAIAHVLVDEKVFHYVVIYKITKEYILIADPARGIVKTPTGVFFDEWTGVLFLMVPSSKFEKGNDTKNIIQRFWNLLMPQKN